MTKKMFEKKVDCIILSYESLASAKAQIENMIEQYGETATLQVEQDYSDGFWINVYAQVPETDTEYVSRLKNESFYKELKEKQDAEEYKRLNAKFEK